MVRDPVLDAQAAEPSICQVHPHLAAYRPLRADREHVAEDQHPKHEHRIDRGTADRRVVWSQLRADPRKIQNTSDLAYAVIVWNDLIETERIEEPPLVLIKLPHHRLPRR